MIKESFSVRSALTNDAVTPLGECQMKSVCERSKLIIAEFDTEDVIVTSGSSKQPPVVTLFEKDNKHISFGTFEVEPPPGGWF